MAAFLLCQCITQRSLFQGALRIACCELTQPLLSVTSSCKPIRSQVMSSISCVWALFHLRCVGYILHVLAALNFRQVHVQALHLLVLLALLLSTAARVTQE